MTEEIDAAIIPRAGTPVRGSRTGQPIKVLFDLIGRRWSMGIVWDLRTQNRRCSGLQACCGPAWPMILNIRLKELGEPGLVEKTNTGYGLTKSDREVFAVPEPLGNRAID